MSGGVSFGGYFPKMWCSIILRQNTILSYRFDSGWAFTENEKIWLTCLHLVLYVNQKCKRHDVMHRHILLWTHVQMSVEIVRKRKHNAKRTFSVFTVQRPRSKIVEKAGKPQTAHPFYSLFGQLVEKVHPRSFFFMQYFLEDWNRQK